MKHSINRDQLENYFQWYVCRMGSNCSSGGGGRNLGEEFIKLGFEEKEGSTRPSASENRCKLYPP